MLAETLPEEGPVRTREPVLDTVDRVSEMCFGLFMALTFVGTVSAATGAQDAGRKMLYTALGCNLAWGLADAVMYLLRTIASRARRHALVLAIQREQDRAAGVRALRDRVPASLDWFFSDDDLESVRARIARSERVPERARFERNDFLAALAIFIIIVLSTFPVAVPFVIFSHVATALLISRVLTLAMLFLCGFALGGYAGWSGWKAGLSMMTVGVLLTMAIIALGG